MLKKQAGAVPALRKWGGQEVKLIARRYTYLLRNNYRPEESGVDMSTQSTPWHHPLEAGCLEAVVI